MDGACSKWDKNNLFKVVGIQAPLCGTWFCGVILIIKGDYGGQMAAKKPGHFPFDGFCR
jgi:hypothetical protein